jgi:hypothetical protein
LLLDPIAALFAEQSRLLTRKSAWTFSPSVAQLPRMFSMMMIVSFIVLSNQVLHEVMKFEFYRSGSLILTVKEGLRSLEQAAFPDWNRHCCQPDTCD